jgi:beta-lactamase class A
VAANRLLDKVGMERVNSSLRAAGFAATRYERRFLDTTAQAQGKENWITAADLAEMLYRLWEERLVSRAVSLQVLGLLKERGDTDRDWVGLGLPPGTRLYHINGTLDGTRNDAAIVRLAGDDAYVLVICQDKLTNEVAGERAIADLARRIHQLMTAGQG